MKSVYSTMVILMLAFLSACTHMDPVIQDPNYVECTEPRPQVCTREYRPVCARRDTGVRCFTTPCPATELKTYGNACSACGDPKVYGYVPGACEKEETLK